MSASLNMKVVEEIQYTDITCTELPFTLHSLTVIPIFYCSCDNLTLLPHVYYSCYRVQEGVFTGLLWLATQITYINCGALEAQKYSYTYRGPKSNRQNELGEFSQNGPKPQRIFFWLLGALNLDLIPPAFRSDTVLFSFLFSSLFFLQSSTWTELNLLAHCPHY